MYRRDIPGPLRITLNSVIVDNRSTGQGSCQSEESTKEEQGIVQPELIGITEDESADDGENDWDDQVRKLVLGLASTEAS